MRLHLMYVRAQHIGYGRYGMNLARELEHLGVELLDTLEKDDPNPANAACWVSVPAHVLGAFKGQEIFMSTMFESSNLPEPFRDGFDFFRKIIVPSDQNVELFSRYHPDVVKVPLGIDPLKWCYVPRQPPERYFVYMIGGTGKRKGYDLAHTAFKRLWGKDGSWGSGPIPKIIFKSPKATDVWGERIEHVAGWVSEERERELYAGVHCYLQPSRGEGFGLQPLQAIAQGIPTILTDAHGHKDFAHLGYGLSSTMTKSDYFIHGDAGDWWEPNLDELIGYMEYVYNSYEEACSFAKMAGDIAREQFTWANTAKQFIEAVGMESLTTPYQGDGSWQKIIGRQYPARTTRFWPCEIAGTKYQFLPGETYFVPADVKRILYEEGVLHPDCVATEMGAVGENEVGLTPEQVERLPQYRVERMHCQMCGQILGSGKRWEPEWDEQGNVIA